MREGNGIELARERRGQWPGGERCGAQIGVIHHHTLGQAGRAARPDDCRDVGEGARQGCVKRWAAQRRRKLAPADHQCLVDLDSIAVLRKDHRRFRPRDDRIDLAPAEPQIDPRRYAARRLNSGEGDGIVDRGVQIDHTHLPRPEPAPDERRAQPQGRIVPALIGQPLVTEDIGLLLREVLCRAQQQRAEIVVFVIRQKGQIGSFRHRPRIAHRPLCGKPVDHGPQ